MLLMALLKYMIASSPTKTFAVSKSVMRYLATIHIKEFFQSQVDQKYNLINTATNSSLPLNFYFLPLATGSDLPSFCLKLNTWGSR